MSPQSSYKHHNTPKRAKLQGTLEYLKSRDLLGQKEGQRSQEDVYHFFKVGHTQAKQIVKSHLDLPHLKAIVDVPEEHLKTDPDARTLANDPRFVENRHGHVKFDIVNATKINDYLERLHRDDPNIMWEVCRQSWVAIAGYAGLEIFGDDSAPRIHKTTIAKRMQDLNWYPHNEVEKAGQNKNTQNQRCKRAQKEVKEGYWASPAFRAKTYCTDKWHFSFQQENCVKIKRKPHHKFAPWTVKEQSNRSRLRVASPNNDYYDLPIITVDEPYKPQKLRNGAVFKKKEPPKQGVIHYIVVISEGYKSPIY